MHKFLIFVIIVSTFSFAASVKEWKNFENGKVHSRKMTNERKEVEMHEEQKAPVVTERLLHSHHRDKKQKVNSLQTTDVKPAPHKNAERHHKKSIEEEMHLRPLNERHHKFPNPALLDKFGFSNPSPKVNRHKFLQIVRRKQNRRRERGGKRMKRNKADHKSLDDSIHNSENNPENKKMDNEVNQAQKKNSLNTKQNDPMQYTQIKNNGFPVKQTSYW